MKAPPPTLFQDEAALFKLLAHPARIAILEALREGEQCVCHLESTLGFRQAYLSQQLAVLRAAGILEDRRESWNIYYRILQPAILLVLDAVEQIHPRRASRDRQRLNNAACNCPKCQRELSSTSSEFQQGSSASPG
jgi:ArsR family transcriptional regulator